MGGALHFEWPSELLEFAYSKTDEPALIAEFGVWKGKTVNKIANLAFPSMVYGFDSFEGLREDWPGTNLAKGAFTRGGKSPKVAQNVRLVKGWFDSTLPGFLNANPGAFSFIHVDSDTYEAADTVLGLAGHRIKAGTVIVFDEYFGYHLWRAGEYRAWHEFVARRGVQYDYLAFSVNSVALKVTAIRDASEKP